MSLRSSLTIPTTDNNDSPASSISLSTPNSTRQPSTRKDRRITKKGRELQRKRQRENQTVVRWLPSGLLVSKAFRVGILGVDRTVTVTVPVSWKGFWGTVVVAVVGGGLVGLWRG